MNVFDQLVDNVLTAAKTGSPFAVATVSHVGAAGADDGSDVVTVGWMGSFYRVKHDPDTAFQVGDVVLMARTQPMVILTRIAG